MVITSPYIYILSKFARIQKRSYLGSFFFVFSFKAKNSRKHGIIEEIELERNGEHGNYTMVSWTHVQS